MSDPYLPSLQEFQFSPAETAVLAAAMQTANPWKWKATDLVQEAAFASAKQKIRAYHMLRHNGLCCYCRTNLNGGGPFMTDREHVLPKSRAEYRAYIFAIWNLGVACKRCNMQFKGSDDDFVVEKTAQLQESSNYRIIHPNFDDYKSHIRRFVVQEDDCVLVKYHCGDSDKGQYTHAYFDLTGLEVNTFDEAQRGGVVGEESELVTRIRFLAREFGQ